MGQDKTNTVKRPPIKKSGCFLFTRTKTEKLAIRAEHLDLDLLWELINTGLLYKNLLDLLGLTYWLAIRYARFTYLVVGLSRSKRSRNFFEFVVS